MSRTRDRLGQRGNVMLVALLALTGLAVLGAVTVSSVQSGLAAASAERGATAARYAAESGLASAMQFLRAHAYYSGTMFSNNIRKDGAWEESASVRGHDVPPSDSDNLFSADYRAKQQTWFTVQFRNNVDDPNFSDQDAEDNNWEDSDGRIVVRVVGYALEGARIGLEAELKASISTDPPPTPWPPSPLTLPVQPRTGALRKITVVSWRELDEVDFR